VFIVLIIALLEKEAHEAETRLCLASLCKLTDEVTVDTTLLHVVETVENLEVDDFVDLLNLILNFF